MKIIDLNNQLQKESLLNEYKGNIFEFLVGLNVSRHFSIELDYLKNINSDLSTRLQVYEQFIREHQADLIEKLDKLGKKTSEQIIEKLAKLEFIPEQIYPIGKSVATNDNQLWAESDLVFVRNQKGHKSSLLMSIKLSKYHSYTNTKSAGIKSFVKKYFHNFQDSSRDQLSLNKLVDESFYQMGDALYQDIGLNFDGSFKIDWTESNPTLPGELLPHQKLIVFKNYSRVMKKLFETIKKYELMDRDKFMLSLLPLCGITQSNLVQITCFHQNHQFKHVKSLFFEELKLELSQGQLKNLQFDAHFFEIHFPSFILQIRIKPMNKFTQASYKINCSIKDIKNE